MKRFLFGLALGLCSFSSLFAGSIDYLSNQSADYIRTFSRNHATDAADAAFYNPAGTAFMKDGLTVQLTNQAVLKDYQNKDEVSGITYKTTEPTAILPSFYAVYKAGSFAGYAGVNIIAGGGSVRYDEGVPFMANELRMAVYGQAKAAIPSLTNATYDSGNLNVEAQYPEFIFGGSYAINNMVSVSLGGRFLYAEKDYEGHASYGLYAGTTLAMTKTLKLDAKEEAFGAGAIIGLDIRPADSLNIGIRFETPTILDFKTTVYNGENLGGLFVDGKKRRKDLPAVLAAGAHYSIGGLTLSTSTDVFFIGLSDQATDNASEKVYNDGYDDDYDSFGYEASLSAEYAIIPDRLKVSAGYMYNKVGGNKDTYVDFDFSLDSHTIGTGMKVVLSDDLELTLSGAHAFYVDGTNSNKTVSYKKSTWLGAMGLDYRFN